MSFISRKRRVQSSLGPRGRAALGAINTSATCPVCGFCGFDKRNARGTVELLHCPNCGRWSPANNWGACGPLVIETEPAYYPWGPGWGPRGGGHHHHGGGGGHHHHHGFGALGDILGPPPPELPPMPTPGAPDEQVALLRRVAIGQEQFNVQDLRQRRIQTAATVALPVLASIWAWGWGWWRKKRSPGE